MGYFGLGGNFCPWLYYHGQEDSMEIKAGEFKAKCLELMDWVAAGNEEILITKRGKPVAKLVAVHQKEMKPAFGCMKGTFEIVGDIVSPLDVQWDANE
jgi:prevent-host-death family protein